MHDVGHLADTGLLTDLAPHNIHLKVMGLLDQGLEVEAELLIHGDPGRQEGEETGAAEVNMTEQLADVVALLLADRAGQGCPHNGPIYRLVNILHRSGLVRPLGRQILETLVLVMIIGRQKYSAALGAGVNVANSNMSFLVKYKVCFVFKCLVAGTTVKQI